MRKICKFFAPPRGRVPSKEAKKTRHFRILRVKKNFVFGYARRSDLQPWSVPYLFMLLCDAEGRLKKAGKIPVLPTLDLLDTRRIRSTFRSVVIVGERLATPMTEFQDYRGQTVCWLPVRGRVGYPDHRAWP